MDAVNYINEAIWGIHYSFSMKHIDDLFPEYEKELVKQDNITTIKEKAA